MRANNQMKTTILIILFLVNASLLCAYANAREGAVELTREDHFDRAFEEYKETFEYCDPEEFHYAPQGLEKGQSKWGLSADDFDQTEYYKLQRETSLNYYGDQAIVLENH
jgi:hypothetical protein